MFKKMFLTWVTMVFIGLCLVATVVGFVDPYFHYRKPWPFFSYRLTNQRSINDGILRHFDYDSIITGTSMTENFKTSEADVIFEGRFIKVPFSGGSWKEINDNIGTAFRTKHRVKNIIRGLDYSKIIQMADTMRNDLGEYPTYLYNDTYLDDYQYLLNKTALRHAFQNILKKGKGVEAFDSYSNWMEHYKFGKEPVLKSSKRVGEQQPVQVLTEDDRKIVLENVQRNIVFLAQQHPETTFYYFLTPYSIVWWGEEYWQGKVLRDIEAEQLVIEQVLQCDNIKLYSFALVPNLIDNLDNYKDTTHYGEWINSDMLKWMKNDEWRLTKDNYLQHIAQEKEYFMNYDYAAVFGF